MYRVVVALFVSGFVSIFCGLFTSGIADPASAQDALTVFPEPAVCPAPANDGDLRAEERAGWSDCEKWVWSCVIKGEEANLFSKECTTPRLSAHVLGRQKWQLVPFVDPAKYQKANALTSKFLETILTIPLYRDAITAKGVRIFGGYFGDPVNLENMAIQTNLVLDGAMMQRGLRLTNFRTEKNLSLDGSNIRGSLSLLRARIDGSIYMEYGAYDTVDLRDARIGASFEGTGSVYNGELRFDRTHIAGKLVLIKARLTMLRGALSQIGGSLDMRVADVRVGIDLSGAVIAGDLRMPEMTFGRRPKPGSAFCDWNPDAETDNLLNRLSKRLPNRELADAAIGEVAGGRPFIGGKATPNVCESAETAGALDGLNTALLRNMKVDGTLCLVDVSGEIAGNSPDGKPLNITTVLLDGTTAKSTILRWKQSPSMTVWHAVDFKTGHMIVNLDEKPRQSYFDQMDAGILTFMTRSAADQIVSKFSGPDSDEELFKSKCDVTPTAANTQEMHSRATQDHIIEFFARNTSRSVQPFANFVSRLEATGLDTTHLKIGLSELKNRNACSTSQLTAAWKSDGWKQVRAQATGLPAKEVYKFMLDSICSGGYSALKYTVSYWHQPLNLIFWFFGIGLFFFALLFFDKPDPDKPDAIDHPGLLYAFDNLIPLKAYRSDHAGAARLPKRKSLRFYLKVHRFFGAMLAVLAFFFIYKAST